MDLDQFNEALKESSKEVNEAFRNFRSSAIAFSVTLIGISGSALYNLLGKDRPLSSSAAGLAAVFIFIIVISCSMQFLHLLGSSHLAHYLMFSSLAESIERLHFMAKEKTSDAKADEYRSKANEHWRRSNRYFGWLDRLTKYAFVIFAIALLLFSLISIRQQVQRVSVLPTDRPTSSHTSIESFSLMLGIPSINWEAVAAIATLLAVIVALLPIWREVVRRRAHARSLRLRLYSKLTVLRPSLGHVIQKGHAKYPGAVMEPEIFRAAVAVLNEMMRESEVLEKGEQDQLGVAMLNLDHAALTYGTDDLHPESARNTLELLDLVRKQMESHGPLEVEIPWKE